MGRRFPINDLTELADNLCQSFRFLFELKLDSKSLKHLDKVVIFVVDRVIQGTLFMSMLCFELLGEGFILLCESVVQRNETLSFLKVFVQCL